MARIKICPDCGAYHSWKTIEKCFNCHVDSQTRLTKFELQEIKTQVWEDMAEAIKDLNVTPLTDWDAEMRELWAKTRE